MKYTDNGIGVDVSRLMGKDFQGTPRITDIFLPGVTTKPAGSGYGLYLVRRALDSHHGSIDLVDYRNGISFKISIATSIE
jgi:nitrogen-specific signal transduction histidine kinase